MSPTRSLRPVFVGGCPRSGTTLLRTMLNSHPDLAIPHETRILIDGYRRRAEWGDLADEENRRRLARWVVDRKVSRYRQLVEDADELVECMVAAPPTVGSVLSAGFRRYADRHGTPRWGEKRPSLVLNLDAVFAMFPDGLYVNIVRDPRAVVASIRKVGRQHGWGAHGIPGATDTWERSARAAERWRQQRSDQCLEVQYEHLVADPAAVLGRIAVFLDLDAAGLDAMLRHQETADIHSRTLHSLVSQPVTTERVRAWEQALRPREIAFVESVLGDRMRRYGYEPVAKTVSVPPNLRRRHRQRRNEMRIESARRRTREVWLQVSYRRPVAAQRY
jgi:Sulfotransferase family